MGTERTSSGNGTEDGFSPDKEHHILIVTKNTGWLGWQFASRVQGKKHKRSTKGSPEISSKQKITLHINVLTTDDILILEVALDA